MPVECLPAVQSAEIASGDTTSTPIPIDEAKFFGLIRPEPWQDNPGDPAALIDFAVEVSASEMGGYVPLYDEAGDAVSIPTGTVVDDGRAVGLDAYAVAMAPFRWVRFVASVAPDADRFIDLHLKG